MMQLNLSAEDIDQLVKDSIMKSGFGKGIDTAINKILTGYNNPIEEELKKYVATITRELLREKMGEQVKAAVTKLVEEKFTEDIVCKILTSSVNSIVKAVKDY